MFKRIRNIFQLQNIYTFIAIVIFGVILNRIKIAHLSKIIPAFVPLLFIPHFYKELKKRNINIIYDCYSATVEKEKNDDDYRDWKECCTFYQNNTYITNIQFSFNNYFTIFDGEITNIYKDNDTYKLTGGYYYYSDHNQKAGIRNNELPNEGENFIFYLIVKDYICRQ